MNVGNLKCKKEPVTHKAANVIKKLNTATNIHWVVIPQCKYHAPCFSYSHSSKI